jgi:chromosome segregation ATPase
MWSLNSLIDSAQSTVAQIASKVENDMNMSVGNVPEEDAGEEEEEVEEEVAEETKGPPLAASAEGNAVNLGGIPATTTAAAAASSTEATLSLSTTTNTTTTTTTATPASVSMPTPSKAAPLKAVPFKSSSSAAEVAQLKAEGLALATKISTISTALKAKSVDLATSNKQLEKAEATNEKLQGEIDALALQHTALKDESESRSVLLHAQIDQLKAELDGVRELHAMEKISAKAALSSETSAISDQARDVARERDELRDELRAVNTKSREAVEKLRTTVQEMTAEHEREKGRWLKETQKPLHDEISALTKANEALRKQINASAAGFEERTKNHSEMIKIYEKISADAKVAKKESSEEIKRLNKVLEEARENEALARKECEGTVTSVKAQNDTLANAVESLQAQLSQAKTKQSAALHDLTVVHERELKRLSGEVEAGRDEIEGLKRSLATAQRERQEERDRSGRAASAAAAAAPSTPKQQAGSESAFLSPTNVTSGSGLGFAQIAKFNDKLAQQSDEIAFLKAQLKSRDVALRASGMREKEMATELADVKVDFEDERAVRRAEIARLASIISEMDDKEVKERAEVVEQKLVKDKAKEEEEAKVEYDPSDYENFMY